MIVRSGGLAATLFAGEPFLAGFARANENLLSAALDSLRRLRLANLLRALSNPEDTPPLLSRQRTCIILIQFAAFAARAAAVAAPTSKRSSERASE